MLSNGLPQVYIEHPLSNPGGLSSPASDTKTLLLPPKPPGPVPQGLIEPRSTHTPPFPRHRTARPSLAPGGGPLGGTDLLGWPLHPKVLTRCRDPHILVHHLLTKEADHSTLHPASLDKPPLRVTHCKAPWGH